MPRWYVRELMRFGAVFWCPVPPPLHPDAAEKMSAEGLARAQAARKEALQVLGNNSANSVPRRATADVQVVKNAFIRVHCHPKRFPAVYACDWKERIVHEGNNYVVVNKPAGVPTAPTVDNILESLPACAAALEAWDSVTSLLKQGIGHDAPLLITSRLDHCTEGLVVLAKSPAFAALYNHLQVSTTQDGEPCIRKYYRALSRSPPPLGPMVHYLKANQRPRGRSSYTGIHSDSLQGAQLSELDVLDVCRVSLTGTAAAEWGETAFESLIELKTGRTHQIRAQLAAAGAPLCGDSLYSPQIATAVLLEASFAGVDGEAVVANFCKQVTEERVWVQQSMESDRRRAPKGAIGLQCAKLVACNLEWTGHRKLAPAGELIWYTFEAGRPWWRT